MYDNYHRQIPLDTDHSGLVKFPNHGDGEYDNVQNRIEELVASAPDVVMQRLTRNGDASYGPLKRSGLIAAYPEPGFQPPTLPPRPPKLWLKDEKQLRGSGAS